MPKTVELNPVMTRGFTRGGVKYAPSPTKYWARITNPGKDSATIEVRNTELNKGRSFSVGDEAEYDSYNLIYTGKIVKITEKCVTILPKYETKRTKRLRIDEFAWRNYNFDVVKVRRENAETSMYI